MDQECDLWGDPIPLRVERRGRPTHEPTDEKRNRVKVLAALKKTQAEIAHAMGISEPTLRRYYLRELKGGLAQLRAAVLVKLVNEALGGNVGAMKEFFRQTERADLVAQPVLTRARRVPPLGKKEQAALEAAQPDTNSAMGDLMARRNAAALALH